MLPEDMRLSNPRLNLISARIQFICGEPFKAVTCAERARELFHRSEDRQGEAKALLALGFFHRQTGNWDSARAVLEEVSSIAELVDDPDVVGEVYYHLAVNESVRNEYETAVEYFHRAAQIFAATQKGEGAAAVAQGLGYVHMKIGRLEPALRQYQFALDYWKGQGNEAIEAAILSEMAVPYWYQGNLGLALEVAQRALAKSRLSVSLRTEGAALMHLSQVYMALGSYQQARSALDASLDIFRQLEYPLEEVYTLDMLGNLHRLTGETSSAAGCFEQGLALARQHLLDQVGGTLQTSKGVLDFEQGNLAGAAEMLEQGLARAKDYGDHVTTGRALYFLACIDFHKRRFDTADALMAELDGLLERLQFDYFLVADVLRNWHLLRYASRRAPYNALKRLWEKVRDDVTKSDVRQLATTPALRSRYPYLEIRSFGGAEVVKDSRL